MTTRQETFVIRSTSQEEVIDDQLHAGMNIWDYLYSISGDCVKQPVFLKLI
jgi:hypothetical protein